MKTYYIYILKCSDGLLYTGVTNNIERRFNEHQKGLNKLCFTYKRRPVELIFHQEFNDIEQAIVFEKKIKKWSRKKKLALANEDFDMLEILSECRNATHSKYNPKRKEVSTALDQTIDCACLSNSRLDQTFELEKKNMNIKNYINGEFTNPINNNWIDNYNPSNGEIYGKIPNSDAQDVENAYESAKKAFPSWSNTSVDERSKILSKIAVLISEKLDFLAKAESKDNGKPISLAKTIDIPRAAANFQYFADAITQFSSEAHESIGLNAINYTLRQPIGVVGCISPWNLPLYLFTWKIAPAIAAGNCVVAKPSEVTPMTAYLLGEICNEAGLPKGVLNIVHGLGTTTGQAIVEHPNIKAISFTGGTETGAHIARIAAPMFKKLSLELGGKNPNIIFADCDYDKMLETTIRSSFANQGQICLCGSRIFVEKSIYERFKKDFVTKVSQLKVGNPSDEDTNIGALVSKQHLEKVQSYIALANEKNATILFGGKKVIVKGLENGYYLQPTIIEVKNNQCKLNQEEIFGPVVTIMPFKTDEEALYLANDVKYGLSATLWTNNLNRTMQFTKQLQVGIVWVNTWLLRDLRTPFGGVKASGVGREGGFEALRFFTEPKNVCIKYE